MVWGYFFGILKAHYIQSLGHFIFDAATVGFYAGLIIKLPTREEQAKWKPVLPWVILLMVWPLFMALIPIQHYLVQLVGLRGNIFWIPMLLVGAILDRDGRYLLAITFAFLNIIAFGFCLAEYFLGVEMFVPENEVTQIVFNSNDIAGGHKRIPSIFVNAHTYAGTMVASIPWMITGFLEGKKRRLLRSLDNPLLVAGLLCSLLGVFMAGPRSPIVVLGLFACLTLLSGRVSFSLLFLFTLVGMIVAYFVSQNERMQRFTELQNLDYVSSRISTSLNMGFVDVLMEYPMGNGMGAGGTSLPFFAQVLLSNQVLMENEYARIVLEQGLPGLILFIAFVFWFFTRRISKSDPDSFGKSLFWILSTINFSTAWLGIGMMSSIPGTAMLMLGIGYCVAPQVLISGKRLFWKTNKLGVVSSGYIPAYQRGLARV
jgi:hypothetical protein